MRMTTAPCVLFPRIKSDNASDNNESVLTALVAHSEDSGKDSWGSHLTNNSNNSDVPYRNVVRNYDNNLDYDSRDLEGSNNVERFFEYSMEDLIQMDQEEPERLQFKRTDKDNSLKEASTAASLDPYPEAYCLGDQPLHACIRNFNDNWPEMYKKEYIRKVICIVEFNSNGSNVMHNDDVDNKLITDRK